MRRRAPPPNRGGEFADDARHEGRAVAPRHGSGPLRIDSLERQREAVGVALAPDLAVRDDVDAGALHVPDRQNGRIVLRLFEEIARNPPELRCVHARHAAIRGRRDRRAIPAADSCRHCRRNEMGWICH
jgi:hypothetical protein